MAKNCPSTLKQYIVHIFYLRFILCNMCTYILLVSLKKELEKRSKEAIHCRKESSHKTLKIDEFRQQISMLTQNNLALRQDKDRFEADCKHYEEEVEILHKKIQLLQESITSPSGDPRSSALNRLIVENPAPQNMSFIARAMSKKDRNENTSTRRSDEDKLGNDTHLIDEQQVNTDCEKEDDNILSPFEFKTKRCGIIGLTKTKAMTGASSRFGRSPCKDKSNFRQLGTLRDTH